MTSLRFLALLSTVLLVVGALLVGEAIHAGVVTGTYDVTSPYVVLRVLVGAVFIALGYRFRTPTEEYVATPSADRPERATDDADSSADATNSPADATDNSGEFDPAMSPLGDDGLEHVETDDDDE